MYKQGGSLGTILLFHCSTFVSTFTTFHEVWLHQLELSLLQDLLWEVLFWSLAHQLQPNLGNPHIFLLVLYGLQLPCSLPYNDCCSNANNAMVCYHSGRSCHNNYHDSGHPFWILTTWNNTSHLLGWLRFLVITLALTWGLTFYIAIAECQPGGGGSLALILSIVQFFITVIAMLLFAIMPSGHMFRDRVSSKLRKYLTIQTFTASCPSLHMEACLASLTMWFLIFGCKFTESYSWWLPPFQRLRTGYLIPTPSARARCGSMRYQLAPSPFSGTILALHSSYLTIYAKLAIQTIPIFQCHIFGAQYSPLTSIPDVLPMLMSFSYWGITMQWAVKHDSENCSNYTTCTVKSSHISKTFLGATLQEVVDTIAFELGFITIPLSGIDVPFHSYYLLAGFVHVSSLPIKFYERNSSQLPRPFQENECHTAQSQYAGQQYIPNLTQTISYAH